MLFLTNLLFSYFYGFHFSANLRFSPAFFTLLFLVSHHGVFWGEGGGHILLLFQIFLAPFLLTESLGLSAPHLQATVQILLPAKVKKAGCRAQKGHNFNPSFFFFIPVF